MKKWIRYIDRTPENEEECLVAFQILREDPECGVCYSLATFIGGVFHSWEFGKPIDDVTHWMQLPDAPRKSRNKRLERK